MESRSVSTAGRATANVVGGACRLFVALRVRGIARTVESPGTKSLRESAVVAMFGSAFALALGVLCHSTRAATVVDLGQPPKGLEWRTVTASALHKLLRSSYVASDDGSLALDYPESTLQWMLGAPGAREELQLGLGEPGSQSLVACVCAAPCELLVSGEQHQALEVGLLCVHHSWRSRGLTPLVTEAWAYPLMPAAPHSR